MFSAACRFVYLIYTDSSHFLLLLLLYFTNIFTYQGGFCSWWKRNFGICEEIDTMYGHKPNESTWDVNFRQKRLACHEDPNHPFQVFDALMNVINYLNFMRVLIEEIKVCCCLRAAKEPAYIVRSNWEFFTITEGHFKGTPACRLKSDHSGQKNKALTINNHTAIDNLKNVQHLPILKTNKKFDTYTMIKRQLYEFLPPDEHIHGPARIFRKEASAKQIKVSIFLFMLSSLFLLGILVGLVDAVVIIECYNF